MPAGLQRVEFRAVGMGERVVRRPWAVEESPRGAKEIEGFRMKRRSSRNAGKSVFHRDAQPSARFSPAFIGEVCACEDVGAFVELMDRRGLWLNRNAAADVFSYLRSLGDEALDDDDLTDVTGGLPWGSPLSDPTVASAISSLLSQLSSH